MKSKLISALVCVSMVATMLVGCGAKEEPAAPAAEETATEAADTAETEAPQATASEANAEGGYELALVTDLGTIDDKSFNQGAWEGMKKYAEENGISYK